MAKTKKPLEAVEVEEVEAVEAAEVVEAVEIIEEPVEVVEAAEVEEIVEVEAVEVAPVVEPVVEAKRKQKKIILKTGKIAISDFAVPVGPDLVWGGDIVKRVLVEADTTINVELHDAADLAKWVRYYKSLEVFGVRVLKFGEE